MTNGKRGGGKGDSCRKSLKKERRASPRLKPLVIRVILQKLIILVSNVKGWRRGWLEKKKKGWRATRKGRSYKTESIVGGRLVIS